MDKHSTIAAAALSLSQKLTARHALTRLLVRVWHLNSPIHPARIAQWQALKKCSRRVRLSGPRIKSSIFCSHLRAVSFAVLATPASPTPANPLPPAHVCSQQPRSVVVLLTRLDQAGKDGTETPPTRSQNKASYASGRGRGKNICSVAHTDRCACFHECRGLGQHRVKWSATVDLPPRTPLVRVFMVALEHSLR